ncbi:2-nitropropane dioxygenase [Cupriavidus sp. USMAA2-4]|uniref:NAD(P)H-dependent flavin oxidoreductase n=1 Tax=Cupriavidus sp. USMAA2-4 TaxID=876364 RepID=UPI0008A70FB2|nr:nitronate monooxygenase [Cupriavidus sp. USMAA2-4]AOY94483.1 2-nitropropane dioxygenase [Cupriavidus sp. USMAA2-4]
MWNETDVSRKLGIRYPIIQGPFGGGLSSVALVAAVSNAGGLGSYGLHTTAPDAIQDLASEIRAATDQPFAFNLWVPESDRDPVVDAAAFDRFLAPLRPYYRELGVAIPDLPTRFGHDYAQQIEAVLEARPPVLSFVFGLPSPAILRECRRRNIVTVGTATTVDEAILLEAAGLDCIVASGFEAGGHRGSFLRTPEASLTGVFALVPQIADRVKTPVIAAGGVADGRGIVAALALGAQGVQIGTAFLACDESGASPAHREKLLSPDARRTVLTRAFTGRLARNIANRFTEEMAAYEADVAPYPVQRWLTGGFRAAALRAERDDLIALAAGQAASLARRGSASSLITRLVDDVGAITAGLAADGSAVLPQVPQHRGDGGV